MSPRYAKRQHDETVHRSIRALAALLLALPGCQVDNDLEDELGPPIPIAVGLLACAQNAPIEIYGYAITPEGGIGEVAGTFFAGGLSCNDLVQRPAPSGAILITGAYTTPGPERPDVVELASDGTFVRNFEAAAPLREPLGIGLALDGTVLVTDFLGGAYRFSGEGAFLGELSPGFVFELTTDVIGTSSGEVLILDYPGAPRVYRFGPAPTGDGTWVLLGEFPDQELLALPWTITEDDDGTFLIGDVAGGLLRFDEEGMFAGELTTAPLGNILNVMPLPGGNIVVLDGGNLDAEPPLPGAVLELSADGTLQRVLAPPTWATDGLSALVLVRDVTLHGRSASTF